MKTNAKLPAIGRTFFTGLIALNLATVEAAARSEITFVPNAVTAHGFDAAQRPYSPTFLAQRLGVAQKFTGLPGVPVKEHGGHKVGRMEDVVVNLVSGRVLCALISDGSANFVAAPGKAFDMADATEARFTANEVNLSAAPHATSSDSSAILRSLPASCVYFGQKSFEDASTAGVWKCSELIGANVRNTNGDALGRVVNVMVDLPTARVVFVIVSLHGTTSDLYAVPPGAFQVSKERSTLVLNADKTKIAALAHSDGFFWSNMAESNWSINAYHAFGQQADFDPAAATQDTVRKEGPVAAADPVQVHHKGDRELTKDILTAMMRDDVENPLIYKNVQIKPVNGQVTLSGRVKNESQRNKLVSIVTSVAGPANVHDELQVK